VKDEGKKKKKKPEGYIDLFAEDDEEEEVSVGSLFSDDDEEEAPEDEADEIPEEPEEEAEEADAPKEDGASDHQDYGMPLPTDEEANYVEPEEGPLPSASDAARETFTFDRYGRRTGKVPRKKRPKERYGKRKNAKKATTTLLLNETEVRREREEAQKRAQERDKLREKQRKMEAEQRRARRKVEAKKRLSALLVLLGLGVLALLAGYFTFLIRSIDVVGYTTRYSEEDLITASGLKRQRHILQQDLDQARENLEKDPYLNTTVKYVFPNRIRITVEERNRAGAVAWGPNKEYIAVIDRAGIVLESDEASYTGLPLVQGLIITGVNPGTRVGDPADEQVQSMLDVLSTLEELGLADKIKTVDLTETMGISLYTPEGYRIEVGDTSDLLTKLNRLKKNYTAIMDKATQYMGRGADAVTIYLYSKNGVVISPHEVGYVAASPSPDATFFAPVQNNPDEPAVTPAPNLPAEPQDTAGPDTPPPFNQGGFTG
jgi:cell division septal protein FtsQ